MKHIKLNLRLLSTLFVLALMVSCSDNEPVNDDTQGQVDTNELRQSAEMDKADAQLDDISIQVYEIQEESEINRAPANFNLPDCVTITVVIEQNYREITIDFGTEGCLVHGNVLSGKIILSYTRDPEAQEVLITKNTEDFTFNALSIELSKTLLKELSNENGNPQFTKSGSITVTWPNGASASREGIKIREWIEGFGSGVWSDNVWLVTGNWTATFVNGATASHTIVTPLRREAVCFFFVSGSVDVVRPNISGTFDYGDGDCDNMATFTTEDGQVFDIILQ